MTLDECKTCNYHRNFENGAVFCGYDKNYVSMATVYNPKIKEYAILNCPKERK
ncbi:MAG: hypothetical protein ACRCUT_13190 [Spirochaetota bacterium]